LNSKKSKILCIDDYELVISYTWSNNNHGICGHTFEVIEYFIILQEHFNVCILLAEDITWDIFYSAIIDKYDLDSSLIDKIKSNTIFFNRPSLVKCDKILFVDGSISCMKQSIILANKIFLFACGDIEIKNNSNPKIFILQDDRIYSPVSLNGIDYRKKILFSHFKSIVHSSSDFLLYGSKNCRNIPDSFYSFLSSKYKGNNFVVLTNDENKPDLPDNFTVCSMPLSNLFSLFSTYIYTPVPRKFDCSPRFIAECKFYNKDVIYEIDYLDSDLGLFFRKKDIEFDFDSLFLTPNDDLINIIKNN
jgi:hypothetical protein